MSDVSCRAFSYFTLAERRGFLRVAPLLEGLPVTRAQLEDERRRVSWDVWASICERAFAQMGGDPSRLAAAGRLVVETGPGGFAGYLGPVVGAITSAEDMYRLITRWGAPSIYRSMTFALERLPDGRLRSTARIKPGYRPCEAWFRLATGALEALPRFIGQPDAIVELETVGPMMATYLVTPPPVRTVGGRLRQVWAALRVPGAMADELARQQEQLSTSFEALRRSEGGFRAALDALPVLVALHRDGVVIHANPALHAALGHAEQAVIGATLTSLVHPDDRARFEREVLGGGVVGVERAPLRLVRADGEVLHVEAGALPGFDFGGRLAAGVFAIDVSARIRTEETNRILLGALPDLVARIDRAGRMVDVHPGVDLAPQAAAAQPMLGRRLPECAGLVPGLRAEHLARTEEALAAAFATRREQRFEQVAEIDGRTRVFELRVIALETGAEALVLIRDVSAQRHTERKLAISERMASLGTLAAGVAHEINNPLTYVLTGLEELGTGLTRLERGEPPDTTVAGLRRVLADVRDGAARVRAIVASLRTFSRVDAEVVARPVDASDLFERAIVMCASELRHRATLVRDLRPVPPVLADPSRLVQVLVNLLMNALQALGPGDPAGQRITVVTRLDEQGMVALEVHDTGAGIAPDRLKHIFDPFFTTKPPGQGTGLGLSISHRIVLELGGEIAVDSEPGRGSCFVVRLPPATTAERAASTLTAPVPRAAAAAAVAVAARARILVIDDEPLVGRALARLFEHDGHVVDVAGDADEALRRLDGADYDLVLCDLMMPRTSGMALYAQVEATAPEVAARFVFATGGAFTDEARAVVARAPRPVIDKPPDLATLRGCVADALARRPRPASAKT